MFKAKKIVFVSILIFSVSICSAIIIDKQAIARNLQLVNKTTTGLGIPASNRLVWDSIAKLDFAKQVLGSAEPFLTKPLPEWNDSIYKTFYTTGKRDQTDAMMKARQVLLPILTLAECIENKGRFMPLIERVLISYCNQPTWTLAAHDWNMDNYKGNFGVDLFAAGIANQFGQTLHLLGNKIDTKVRKLALKNLEKRVFTPVIKSLDTPNGQHWWLTTDNNWNAVCVAGVTAAALATETNLKKRAFFVSFGEQQIKHFLSGFKDDGYCVEGIGYFSYGFGYFMLLRETLMNATNSKIDLLKNEKVAKIAIYPLKSEIINGIYPAIADCGTNSKPAEWIMHHLRKNYNWNTLAYASNPTITQLDLMSDLIHLFGNNSIINNFSIAETSGSIRSFFPSIGLLYSRPQRNTDKNKMAIAIMGGSNGFSHNHNDLGTYNIVMDKDLMMGDMGGPKIYTNKTFSKERYSLYKTFSSIGHPVPLVDGVEQHESKSANGVVIDTMFTDAADRIVYELKSGYKLQKLKSLTRTMIYERKDSTIIKIIDTFSASSPITFETALTTRENVTIEGSKIYISTTNKKLEIGIDSKVPFSIQQTEIADYGMQPFTRIAILLNNKVSEGDVVLTYKIVSL